MKKRKASIKWTLLRITIIPIVLLIGILTLVSVGKMKSAMEAEVVDGLKGMCTISRSSIVSLNSDPLEIRDNVLYKGEIAIGSNEAILDDFVEGTDYDLTIFYGDTRYITTIIGSDGKRPLGTKADAAVAADVLGGNEYFAKNLTINGEDYYAYYIPYIQDGKPVGMVFAGTPSKGVTRAVRQSTMLICLVAIIGMLISAAFSFWISTKLAGAISKTEKVLTSLSEGDLTIEVDPSVATRKDELGTMGRSVETLVEELRSIVGKIQEASRSVLSSGDELESMANMSSQTADDIASAVDDISKGAVTQAEDVETATSKVAEMGQIIESIVANIGNLNETSLTMLSESNESAQIMQELATATNNTVQGIQKVSVNVEATDVSVQAITEAVNLITGIASQTNLLSLNASIEAARAGEAGKGFAVVASEIQHLSDESSSSAKRIADIVKQLSMDSRNSMEVMEEVKAQLKETQSKLDETMSKFQVVNTGIESSRTGTNEINTQAQDCDEARGRMVDIVQNLSAISEENATSTEETTASMQELNATINLLAESARQLKELAVELDNNTKFFQL